MIVNCLYNEGKWCEVAFMCGEGGMGVTEFKMVIKKKGKLLFLCFVLLWLYQSYGAQVEAQREQRLVVMRR